MKRLPNLSILTLGGMLALSHSAAHAQYYNSPQVRPNNTYSRPPVLSPYLNLIPVRPAGVNYFLNVVPEMDRRAQVNQIHSQIYDLERQRTPTQQAVEDPVLPPIQATGHPVGFLNYAPYYSFSPSSIGASTNQYFRPPSSRGSRSGN